MCAQKAPWLFNGCLIYTRIRDDDSDDDNNDKKGVMRSIFEVILASCKYMVEEEEMMYSYQLSPRPGAKLSLSLFL